MLSHSKESHIHSQKITNSTVIIIMSHHHQRNCNNRDRAPTNLNRRNRNDQQQQRRSFPFQRIRARRPPHPTYGQYCPCPECHPNINRFINNDMVSNGGGLSDEELRRCVKVAEYRRRDECAVCAICLDDLFQQQQEHGGEEDKGGDDREKKIRVGMISMCGHKFHYECIETWLRRNNSCPLCKAAVKPPLSDTVK